MSGPERTWAAASVAGGAALLAFAPIGMRLSELGPQATAFWRFMFALPLLGLAFALSRRRPSLRDSAVLAAAGVSFGLDIALFHASIVLTTVANATLFSNMTPIFAAAAGWLFLRQRIGRGWLIGAAIGALGAVLLSVARARAGHGVAGGTGDALGLASALFYAGYLLIVSRVRQRASTSAVMLVTTAASAVLVLILALCLGEALAPQSLRGWLVLAGLGVVVHVGGQGLIALGIGRLPIAVSTVLLWIQPVMAALLSWALFAEALGPVAILGAALVLGGVWIVQRTR